MGSNSSLAIFLNLFFTKMRQKVSPWPVRVLVSVLTDFNYFYKYVPNTMFLFCLFDLGCKRRKREQVKLAQICHSSLLSVFGLNATSTYDSYLPLIFGKFALI